jgi:uncharacterized protein YkwD
MMKKKAILTVAAAAALMLSNPVLNKAHAASYTPTVNEKVYVYQGTNMNEINSFIEKYFASLGIKVPQNTGNQPVQTQPKQTVPTQQPSQTTATKPVQQKPVTANQPKTTQSTSNLSAYEQKVVDLTNQERAKNGLPALKVDLTLSKMAHEKSRDMSANGYFSHTSPTYGSPFDMMKKYGISYRAAGENIAMVTARTFLVRTTPILVLVTLLKAIIGHRNLLVNSKWGILLGLRIICPQAFDISSIRKGAFFKGKEG